MLLELGHGERIGFANEEFVKSLLENLTVGGGAGEKSHAGAELEVVGVAEDLLGGRFLDGVDQRGAVAKARSEY